MSLPGCLDIARAANLEPGRVRGGEHFFRCPRHDDREPSLRINPAKKGFSCKPCNAEGNYWEFAAFLAGVDPKDKPAVMSYLVSLGLVDRKPEIAPAGQNVVARYPYADESGNLLFEVVRFEPKRFRQRRPDGKGGWIWDAEGVRRVPYNLPELRKAGRVFVVEGEKDVESLRGIGLTATCNPGGADNWTDGISRHFSARYRPAIIPDNDDPGRRHARKVAESLHGRVASLKVLELDGLPEKGDVSDWLRGRDPEEAAQELTMLAEAAPEWRPIPSRPRFEQVDEDRYRLNLPDARVTIEVDRLRRERQELVGELCVRCDLPGARICDGALSIADFNLSSARARTERAALLARRSNAEDLDWAGFLEEFSQRVLAADRIGPPAVDLRELERPGPDDALRIEGLSFPRRHATIIFGDGGAAKSYAALYLCGRLARQGIAVALFDWELAGEDHRDRLERLFGDEMPRICYARCERPLVYEVDRLRRIVRDEGIGFAVFDSVAFACDGPPESAESAGRYFRAVRRIGTGSLHIAHVTKGEGADQKPFGSVFWHNGARSTWYAKLVDASPDGRTLSLGLFNRKANLGRLHRPAGFRIAFTAARTCFTPADPAESPDLAEKMTIRERMIHVLRGGAMPLDRVAEELEAEPDSIRRTVRRHKTVFTVLEGGKVGLLQRFS